MKPIPNPFDIEACCKSNRNAMLNTATGRWLAAACREIESLRKRIEQLERYVNDQVCDCNDEYNRPRPQPCDSCRLMGKDQRLPIVVPQKMVPLQPLTLPQSTCCLKCGIDLAKATHYVCTDSQCPHRAYSICVTNNSGNEDGRWDDHPYV